jgi:hypothetical protein
MHGTASLAVPAFRVALTALAAPYSLSARAHRGSAFPRVLFFLKVPFFLSVLYFLGCHRSWVLLFRGRRAGDLPSGDPAALGDPAVSGVPPA